MYMETVGENLYINFTNIYFKRVKFINKKIYSIN